jgi:Ser/Thr protein kinase RdoA (MazF antagonist)
VLRRTPVPAAVQEWLRRQTGARVVAVRRLPGASSSAVHVLRLDGGGSVVLRRYVWSRFLAAEPEAPEREVDALTYAQARGLPVPAVVAADPHGIEIGDGVPALLMARLPGRADARADPEALASAAADIHAIDGRAFGHRYVPWYRATSTGPPRGCRSPGRWADALEIWRSAEPPYTPTFVHRDFHPGNVLWVRGRLSGVVDWANACAGPPGIDVATCRWNLAAWAGPEAADAFVAAYERRTGQRHDRYWDIAKVMEDDWDLVDDPQRVDRAERFLAAMTPYIVSGPGKSSRIRGSARSTAPVIRRSTSPE